MYLEIFNNFNAILKIFLGNKNITHGINHKLHYLVIDSSVYKIKIIYRPGQEDFMLQCLSY